MAKLFFVGFKWDPQTGAMTNAALPVFANDMLDVWGSPVSIQMVRLCNLFKTVFVAVPKDRATRTSTLYTASMMSAFPNTFLKALLECKFSTEMLDSF